MRARGIATEKPVAVQQWCVALRGPAVVRCTPVACPTAAPPPPFLPFPRALDAAATHSLTTGALLRLRRDGLIAVNYAARAFGVKRNGTSVAEARRLCPDIQFIHVQLLSALSQRSDLGLCAHTHVPACALPLGCERWICEHAPR